MFKKVIISILFFLNLSNMAFSASSAPSVFEEEEASARALSPAAKEDSLHITNVNHDPIPPIRCNLKLLKITNHDDPLFYKGLQAGRSAHLLTRVKDALHQRLHITHLYLENFTFQDKAIRYLSELLDQCSIQELTIDGPEIPLNLLSDLFMSIAPTVLSLKALSLHGTSGDFLLTTIGLLTEISALPLPHLEKIDFSRCPFVPASQLRMNLMVFRPFLEANPQIQSVMLNESYLDSTKAALLIKYLTKHNTSLMELRLSKNLLYSEPQTAIHALAELLRYKPSLSILDIGGNQLTGPSAKILATAMVSHQALRQVYLGQNDIGDEGAIALAEVLGSGNSKIGYMDVSYNNIGRNVGQSGAKALAVALAVNSSLKVLNLTGNAVGDEGAMVLAQTLGASDTPLEELYLGDNAIGVEGVMEILAALKHNRTLRILDLSKNKIEYREGDIETLSNILVASPLEKLILPSSKMKPQKEEILRSVGEANPNLEIIF